MYRDYAERLDPTITFFGNEYIDEEYLEGVYEDYLFLTRNYKISMWAYVDYYDVKNVKVVCKYKETKLSIDELTSGNVDIKGYFGILLNGDIITETVSKGSLEVKHYVPKHK